VIVRLAARTSGFVSDLCFVANYRCWDGAIFVTLDPV
jgi:hypothetical protein